MQQNPYLTSEDFLKQIGSYQAKDDFRELMKHYATKEDVANSEIRLIKWLVATGIGSATVAVGLAVLVERLIN